MTLSIFEPEGCYLPEPAIYPSIVQMLIKFNLQLMWAVWINSPLCIAHSGGILILDLGWRL